MSFFVFKCISISSKFLITLQVVVLCLFVQLCVWQARQEAVIYHSNLYKVFSSLCVPKSMFHAKPFQDTNIDLCTISQPWKGRCWIIASRPAHFQQGFHAFLQSRGIIFSQSFSFDFHPFYLLSNLFFWLVKTSLFVLTQLGNNI